MLTSPFPAFLSLPLEVAAATLLEDFRMAPAHCEVKWAEAVPVCDVDTLLFLGPLQLGSKYDAFPFLGDSNGSLPVVNMAADRLVPSRGFS